MINNVCNNLYLSLLNKREDIAFKMFNLIENKGYKIIIKIIYDIILNTVLNSVLLIV